MNIVKNKCVLIAPLQDRLSSSGIYKNGKDAFSQLKGVFRIGVSVFIFVYLGCLLRHLDAKCEFLVLYCFVGLRISMSLSTLNPRLSKVRNTGGNCPVISCDRSTSGLQRLESYASRTKACGTVGPKLLASVSV